MKFFLLTAALLASLISPNAFGEGKSLLQVYGLNASTMQSTQDNVVQTSSTESKQMIVPMINWSEGDFRTRLIMRDKMDQIGDWFSFLIISLILCVMSGAGGFMANLSYFAFVDEPSILNVTIEICCLMVIICVGGLTTIIGPLPLISSNPWIVPLLLEAILVSALIGARLARYVMESDVKEEEMNLA